MCPAQCGHIVAPQHSLAASDLHSCTRSPYLSRRCRGWHVAILADAVHAPAHDAVHLANRLVMGVNALLPVLVWISPGVCDDDVAMCYCPPETKYGHVPAPEGSPLGTRPIRQGRPMYQCYADTVSQWFRLACSPCSIM